MNVASACTGRRGGCSVPAACPLEDEVLPGVGDIVSAVAAISSTSR